MFTFVHSYPNLPYEHVIYLRYLVSFSYTKSCLRNLRMNDMTDRMWHVFSLANQIVKNVSASFHALHYCVS